MTDKKPGTECPLKPKDETARLEALSDGVFAIAMTLMAFTFDVIKMPSGLAREKFLSVIVDDGPALLHYLESFIIVAAFWMMHHRQFRHIIRADWRLVWMNTLALMFVVLTPVTSTLVGDYGHWPTAAAIFEVNLLAAGLMFYITWIHAVRQGLVDVSLTAVDRKWMSRRNLIIPVVSVMALGLCWLVPRGSTLLYFLVPVLMVVMRQRGKASSY